MKIVRALFRGARITAASYLGACSRPDGRAGPTVLGIICLVMIANLQYS
jgi:hypothetical protein